MKASLFALSLVVFSSLAHADLAELHQKKCEGVADCRVVITPKKMLKQGMCVGIFMGSLPCAVSYLSAEEGAMMNLTCGTDPAKPVIDQDMAAEALGYTVTALSKKADGQTVVNTDAFEYGIISNRMVDVSILSATTAEVGITLQSGRTTLTNVSCQ